MLITGESGTGKERVARLLHRVEAGVGPFVAVNCGAMPETLLECELFGYERGAFTGAVPGRGGSSWRDERDACSWTRSARCRSPMQVKLLRALQEREITRLGGERPLSVSIRHWSCATPRI